MIQRVARLSVLALVAVAGCSSTSSHGAADGSAGAAPGTISGTVHGTKWTNLSNAYWIGKTSPGSPKVIVFLFEAPMDCATLKNVNWDKTALGEKQLLEIGVLETMTGSFQIPKDASVAYLRGAYNPDADAGKVTIETIHPSKNLVGGFDVTFMGDALKGSFDAKYCADGVEP